MATIQSSYYAFNPNKETTPPAIYEHFQKTNPKFGNAILKSWHKIKALEKEIHPFRQEANQQA